MDITNRAIYFSAIMKFLHIIILLNARNENKELQVYSCVLVVATYAKKFGLHFDEELYAEREFGNFVDRYTVAKKKDSSDYILSGFENSFRSYPTHFVAKYSKYKHCTKNLMRNAKSYKMY